MHVTGKLAAVVCSVVLAASASAGTYYTVDSELGGPMQLGFLSSSYDNGLNRWTLNMSATNTGASPLADVHFVMQFIWDLTEQPPAPAFAWNDSAKIWEYPAKQWYWDMYGVAGQNLLMPLSRAVVDTPLSWTEPGLQTAYVQATDSVPAFALGDFAGGQMKTFTMYADVPTQFNFNAAGYFVAAVPLPAAAGMGLLAACGILLRRRTGR